MSDDKPVIGSITQLTQSVNLQDIDISDYKPKEEKHCGFEYACLDKGHCPANRSPEDKCLVRPRKAFRTVVDTKTMWVYDCPGVEHNLGKWNNSCATWWLAYERWDSTDDDICRRNTGDQRIEWIPWLDNGANRPCFDIQIRQGNRIKNKWNESDVRGTCSVDISCNGEKVYEFGCRDVEYGMAKAQYLIIDMQEHPFNFMNPEEEIGRRIWYYQQPAVIKSLHLDQGCIMIEYVGKGKGFDLSQPWDKEDHDVSEWQGEKTVKDDIFASSIYWFRSEGDGEETDNNMIKVTNERGHTSIYPKALYEKIKYDVEYEFRRQFGIERGGGNMIFFDRKKYDIPANKPLIMSLDKYDKRIQEFHKGLVEEHKLNNP